MEQYLKWHPPTQVNKCTSRKKRNKNDLKPDWHQYICPFTRAVSGSTTHVG
jgi:hypothetical protein